MTGQTIELIPIKRFPTVSVGDDIAQLTLSSIHENDVHLIEGDILVITHSIISVAEGSLYELASLEISEKARQISKKAGEDPKRVEAALRESVSIIKDKPILITKTKHRIITDFSGVDESNAPLDTILALPNDPDSSAHKIHEAISEQLGFNVPVIVTDTQGRPWRKGAVNLAIGVAGMSPFVVNKGKEDLYERELKGSLVCLADQIAAAAELVMGQANEGIPVVLVRGIEFKAGDGKASDILRKESEDLFS
ncbi:MAG: coenzyme F420-0:L-glutamate ligase [Candidatus Thorarchaeota archaeon]